jgi:hypothetical protein
MIAVTLLFFSVQMASAQEKKTLQVSPNVQMVLGKVELVDVPEQAGVSSELVALFDDLAAEVKKQLETGDTENKCVVTVGLRIKPKVRLVDYTIDKKGGVYSQYTGRYIAKSAEEYQTNLQQLAGAIATKVK